MRVILLGVSGSGKTAIGKELSGSLKIPFFDGDDYHSASNKEKMQAGIPLTDADRWPWLQTLAKLLHEHRDCILACSALKESYRNILKISSDVLFVYLKGDDTLIRKRLEGRKGHFFNPTLLKSQFETLEEPKEGLVIDISPTVPEIVAHITKLLKKYTIQ